jgi:hypothetical protein
LHDRIPLIPISLVGPEVQQRRMSALHSWKEIHMAISGYYSHGIVSLIADADASNLTVSRNAAGTLLVNGGAVAISGGVPTVANTSLIQVFGLGGDEFITLDESIGELPRANVFGGAGADLPTGSSGASMLFG